MEIREAEELVEKLLQLVMRPLYFQNMKLLISDVRMVRYLITEWDVPPHSHPWFELNYITSGSFYTTFNSNECLLEKGETSIMPPGSIHSHRPHNGEFATLLSIRFQIEKTNDSEIFYDEFYRFLSSLSKIQYNIKLDQLLNKLRGKSDYRLISALFDWITEVSNKQFNNQLSNKTHIKAIIYQVDLFVEKNYSKKINGEIIANFLNISYRTLARYYRSETGITINKKIQNTRINKAKELLIKTNYSLAVIAQKVGFNDEYYFSTAFKRDAFMSPKNYRKKFNV